MGLKIFHRFPYKLTTVYLVLLVSMLPGLGFSQNPNSVNENVGRIGVLAFRGVEAAMSRWEPLARYLTETVPEWRFELVPVTLVSAPEIIEEKSIDFIITNPGHYVTLAQRFNLQALSTLERTRPESENGLLQFGTVIFTRKDSDIRAFDDLTQKKIAAVSPAAFGGFQIAWHELKEQGVDIFEDPESVLHMGFPQDAIVFAVLDGEVDAGIVRSGLLELLASEGRLSLDQVHVLNSNMHQRYPYMTSSRLYPEWPFSVLPSTEKRLTEHVLIALLETQQPQNAVQFNLKDIWSAPLSYSRVRSLVTVYQNHVDKLSDGRFITRFAIGVIAIAFALLSGLLVVIHLLRQRAAIKLKRSEPVNSYVADSDAVTVNPGYKEQLPDMAGIRERFQSLTNRERQVLVLVCQGLQTKAIAAELHISPKTVEYHRNNLLHKTEAGTTPHLVQLATRLGFDLGLSLG